MHTFSFVIFATSLFLPAAASAQLNVLMSGGFSGAYEQLLPEFERTSGVKVTTRSGASQGSGPQTIAAQLARGVPADVVILSREGLTELIAANKITGGTDVNLAQVPLGIAVRAKAAKPDVSTVAAFKQTMTGAKKIALPGSTSGIWLKNDLFPRLGIADKISIEMKPRGTDGSKRSPARDSWRLRARSVCSACSSVRLVRSGMRISFTLWTRRGMMTLLNTTSPMMNASTASPAIANVDAMRRRGCLGVSAGGSGSTSSE